MRICSLLPSATEIVADLGLVGSLVGVSEECDWPPEVRGLPVVTASRVDTTRLSSLGIDKAVSEAVGDGRPLYAIDRELLETLQPDLILTLENCLQKGMWRWPPWREGDALLLLKRESAGFPLFQIARPSCRGRGFDSHRLQL